jgi:hypothetical protein
MTPESAELILDHLTFHSVQISEKLLHYRFRHKKNSK